MARLRIQAAFCTFDNLDSALREQFVQGLHNEAWRLLTEDKPLPDVLKLAQGIEAATKGSDVIHGVKAYFRSVRSTTNLLPPLRLPHTA